MNANVSVENGKIVVNGNVGGAATIKWRAAAPPTRGHSFSGAGLPHPNQEQAYDVRSTGGTITTKLGDYRIVLDEAPGAYYSGLGSIYVPPHVELEITTLDGRTTKENVLMDKFAVRHRWISGAPPGHAVTEGVNEDEGRAMFHRWNPDGGVRSQEAILRSRGYNQH
jgi:hypothetical protein